MIAVGFLMCRLKNFHNRHNTLVLTREERMEGWVIIWHPILFEDV